jgi:hypothetical protein
MHTLQELLDADDAPRRALLQDHYMDTVLPDRAARYAAHVASMDLSPEIVQWAMLMAKGHEASYVKMDHFYCDWITMLLIKRYGEEPNAYDAAEVAAAKAEGRVPNCSTDVNYKGWPKAFTANDVRSAFDLIAHKRWPEGLKIVKLTPAEA